jgi:hypothetical protein
LFRTSGVATRTLIFINVLVYLGQISSSGALTNWLYYTPLATFAEPWRMITSGFAHSDNLAGDPTSVLHIALNMYTLYILGNLLEPTLGTRRFVVLYMLSVFGGSVAVLVLGDPAGGTDFANGRHPVKMFEPTAASDAPQDIVYLILGTLQFSEAALRVYGHPDLLAVAAAGPVVGLLLRQVLDLSKCLILAPVI